MPRRPVRIVFANCPHLDREAACYLLLAQNRAQSVLEFELYHVAAFAEHFGLRNWRSRVLKRWSESPPWLARRWERELELLAIPALRSVLPLSTGAALIEPFVIQHDSWISGLKTNYGGWTLRLGPTIIITETPVQGGYFGLGDDNFAVISVTDFHRKYTPPSLLEFVLTNVQRYALRLAINKRIGSITQLAAARGTSTLGRQTPRWRRCSVICVSLARCLRRRWLEPKRLRTFDIGFPTNGSGGSIRQGASRGTLNAHSVMISHEPAA